MQPATTDCQERDQQRKRDNKFDNIGRLLRVVTPVLHPVTALAIVVMSAGWPRVTVLQVQPPVEVLAFIVIMAMQFQHDITRLIRIGKRQGVVRPACRGAAVSDGCT